MAMSLRARDGKETAAQSGPHGWKDQWSAWLVRSMVAAAVAHAVAFALWPVWDVRFEAPERPVEVVQIDPIVGSGGDEAPEDGFTTALPTREEVEIDLARGGASAEELEELLARLDQALAERLDGRRLDATNPRLATTAYGRPAAPLPPELSLDEVTVAPRLATLPPNVAWPLIRNPRDVVRFLRSKYNPVHQAADLTGAVSVAMWVNERGSVDWTEVRESSGRQVVDDIALAMFREVAMFRPARRKGSPVPVAVVIRVPFDAPW